MKNKHTPEKLEVFFDGMSHLIKEATPTGYNIARTHFGVEKDGIECEPGNARRLVACWNACDGIPTDDIEGSNLWADWLNEKSENATLRAENERLKLAHENTWQALSRMTVYGAIKAAELELRREELEKEVEPMSDEAYEAAISGVSDDHPGMD